MPRQPAKSPLDKRIDKAIQRLFIAVDRLVEAADKADFARRELIRLSRQREASNQGK